MKKAEAGWGGRPGGASNGHLPCEMPPEVGARVQRMFADGVCRPADLDARCLEQLAKVPVHVAVEAVNQFSNRDLSDVRNCSALFVSIVRKVQRDCEGRGVPPSNQIQGNLAPGPPGLPLVEGGPVGQFQLQGGLEVQQVPGQVAVAQMPIIAQMGFPQRPVAIGVGPAAGNGAVYDPLEPSAITPPIVAANLISPLNQGLPGVPGVLGVPGVMDRRNYGMEQLQMGVRVDEFHGLSVFATYVHPAPALKLQQLWDEGVRLVSLLDDGAWDCLASLKAAEGLAAIEEVVENMQGPNNLRNVNAFFMSVARRYLPPNNTRVSGAAASDRQNTIDLSTRRIVRAVRQSPKGVVGDLEGLFPEVQEKISEVLGLHPNYITITDFDQGVVESLKRLPEGDAIGVIDDLGAQNLTNVNNMPAFIMSIIRRRQRMAAQ
eukprot:evm.model.scf_1618.3 EVM.evm.TU.scf_1618.3   scf_1618:19296-21016(+)